MCVRVHAVLYDTVGVILCDNVCVWVCAVLHDCMCVCECECVCVCVLGPFYIVCVCVRARMRACMCRCSKMFCVTLC